MWLAGILTCSTAACAEIAGLGVAPSGDDAGVTPDGGPGTDADAADGTTDVASETATDASMVDAGPLSLSLSPPLVHLVQGATASLTVTVDRGVYGGDVLAELQGLPTGVTATGTTVPAGSSSGTITLSAAMNATLGPAQLTAWAAGSSGGGQATLLVQGAPGTVDTTFGVNGIARAPFTGTSYMALATQQGIALTPDGRILLCGNVEAQAMVYETALVRFEGDGSLDNTFNGAGTALWEQPGNSDVPTGCGWVPSSSLILLGGFSRVPASAGYHSFLAAAFASNGSTDYSYGEGGVYEPDLGVDSKIVGVAVGADGSLVALGFSGSTSEIFRLTATGGLDSTFGASDAGSDAASGVVGMPAGVGLGSAGYLSDGRLIVLAGSSSGCWLERYSANGVLDETYGDGGSGQAISLNSLCWSVVAADDSVVVGGLAANDAGTVTGAIGLAHFETNGQLDPGFGGAGTTTTNLPGGSSPYFAIAVGEDGRIATALSSGDSPGSFSAAVFLPTGALDTSFGDGGFVTTSVGTTALPNDVAIDPLGRILVAGTANDPTDSNAMDAVVVRYWP
jgi:uncharacterized delta-60 repeat protein